MIQCDSLVKIYEMEQHKVMALEGLDLTIEDGEMMAIIGKSGSGKSTLLNIIGGLETPTAGILMVDGKDLSSYTDSWEGNLSACASIPTAFNKSLARFRFSRADVPG